MSLSKLFRNKKIIGWSLYDFANQPFTTIVVTFIYSAFFTKVIAPNESVGTTMWANSIALTAIIVSLLAPIFGAIADHGGLRKRFLVIFTWLCSFFTILLFFPSSGQVYFALILFLFANITFEMGTVLCNSYLSDLSDNKNSGRISGFAWGLGFVGGLLALFICFILFDFNDSTSIRKMNVFVGLWFLIFSVPTFLFLKDKNKNSFNKKDVKNAFLSIVNTFSSVSKYKIISKFLIARLFFNDGLITIFGLGGIYAITTLDFDFNEVMQLGIILNITAAIGSFAFGYIEDHIGVKRVINLSLIVLIFATLLAYIAPETNYPKQIFWIAGILIGLMAGPNQSCSRSLMSQLTPENKKNEFFGFFALTGKATAFLGPFLFGLITSYYNQQAALWVVISFFVIGFCLFNRIKFNSLN